MTYAEHLVHAEDYLRRAGHLAATGEARAHLVQQGVTVYTADVGELTALGAAHALMAMARMAEPAD